MALAPLTERRVKCEGVIESHTLRIDDLTTRIVARETAEGSSDTPDTMKSKIATLRKKYRGSYELKSLGHVNLAKKVAMHNETVAEDESGRVDEEFAEETYEKELRSDK
uniref:Uncharacterized protein n=1 Tax=Solanum tuberosum TaxID=4113 RepID=M1DAS1_SOLTU